jgi:hypothetical protein
MKLQKIHKKIYILILLLCIILVSVFSGIVPVEHLNDDDNNGREEYINHVIGNTIKNIFNNSCFVNQELFTRNMEGLEHIYVSELEYKINNSYKEDFNNIKKLIIKDINSISSTEDINNKIINYLCEKEIKCYNKKN